MKNKHHFFLERRPWMGDRAVGLNVLRREFEPRRNLVATGLQFDVLPDGADVTGPPPLLGLTGDEAQQLMDELWNCGIRPAAGAGSAGSLAATERHLEDMRALVFKQPKPPTRSLP